MKRFVEKNTKGFTLIELIIAIGLFGLMTSLLMANLSSVYHYRDIINSKKDLNFEASSLLNNGLPGILRSGFAIHYDETRTESDLKETTGVQGVVDQLSIFTDQAETQYFTIYRKDYQTEGEDEDTAQLYIRFSNGKEFPLHSSETVVEDFKVQIPTDPRLTGDRDIQPYIKLYFRFRQRYPFGEITDKSSLKPHQIIRTSYSTSVSLRNVSPASYKNSIKE